ncbi:MAG: lytic transglycosylase domain-containing protein [Clostridium sp.]|uniref:lytic transglycosylase domain-containing protein n=1 Tax=Clostridium sp. TaxID=1506 RepID=UPI002FCB27AF
MEFEKSKSINLKFFRVMTMVVVIIVFTNIYLLSSITTKRKLASIKEVGVKTINYVNEEQPEESLQVPYNKEIIKYSKLYNLDPYLIAAIIKTESSFNSEIISSMGATGLMQIMPSTAEWIATNIGIENFSQAMLQNPEINIQMGCWYLSYLQKQFTHKNEVLAAYNGGMGNVLKWLNDQRYSDNGEVIHTIPFKETLGYIEKVDVVYNQYIEMYNKN